MRALLILLALLAGCEPAPSTVIPPIPDVPLAKPIDTAQALPAQMGPAKVARWGTAVRREGQAVYGITSPTPMFLGQIAQESSGDEKVTASDLGRGLAQFMDATAKQVAAQYPELGAPDPYNPTWAIRAMVRLDQSNYRAVKGDNACERWGAGLTAYNAGAGWVRKAQAKSSDAGVWFGLTELVNGGQSAQNFKYSRLYPRWVLIKHQPKFQAWGPMTCEGLK